jgi:hypothetical protein
MTTVKCGDATLKTLLSAGVHFAQCFTCIIQSGQRSKGPVLESGPSLFHDMVARLSPDIPDCRGGTIPGPGTGLPPGSELVGYGRLMSWCSRHKNN